eukprot:gene5808-11714_t
MRSVKDALMQLVKTNNTPVTSSDGDIMHDTCQSIYTTLRELTSSWSYETNGGTVMVTKETRGGGVLQILTSLLPVTTTADTTTTGNGTVSVSVSGLKSANLAQYLRSFQLPGMATRLNDKQVNLAVETFSGSTLSLDEFEYWFTQIGKLDTSEELDPDLIINSLIEYTLFLHD